MGKKIRILLTKSDQDAHEMGVRHIAGLLREKLHAKGVAVVVQATHTCMTCRGIKKAGSLMITSAVRGLCRSDARTRSEFLTFIDIRDRN